jgi:protein O-GlcNAc transferase
MASTPISPALMSHLQSGMQHLQTGNAHEADAEFRLALQLDENNVQANYACALASYQFNRLAEAEQFLRRVIQLQPHFYPAFNTLGITLRAAGNNAEGIAALEHALAIKPDYAEAAFNLALAFADSKERTKAISLYRRVLALKR